jgi:hypothetical protein
MTENVASNPVSIPCNAPDLCISAQSASGFTVRATATVGLEGTELSPNFNLPAGVTVTGGPIIMPFTGTQEFEYTYVDSTPTTDFGGFNVQYSIACVDTAMTVPSVTLTPCVPPQVTYVDDSYLGQLGWWGENGTIRFLFTGGTHAGETISSSSNLSNPNPPNYTELSQEITFDVNSNPFGATYSFGINCGSCNGDVEVSTNDVVLPSVQQKKFIRQMNLPDESFTVPDGVTSVSFIVAGAGGNGADNGAGVYGADKGGGGGGGGALIVKNNLTVTPGQTFNVSFSSATRVMSGSDVWQAGNGANAYFQTGGAGGTYDLFGDATADVARNGGRGGDSILQNHNGQNNYGGGGGGLGDQDGSGGNGTFSNGFGPTVLGSQNLGQGGGSGAGSYPNVDTTRIHAGGGGGGASLGVLSPTFNLTTNALGGNSNGVGGQVGGQNATGTTLNEKTYLYNGGNGAEGAGGGGGGQADARGTTFTGQGGEGGRGYVIFRWSEP